MDQQAVVLSQIKSQFLSVNFLIIFGLVFSKEIWKNTQVWFKTYSMTIYIIQIELWASLLKGVPNRHIPLIDDITSDLYSWKQEYSTPLMFSINSFSKQVVQHRMLCLQ